MNVKESEIEYKSFYTIIFSTNYFFQGITTSVFTVIIPIYLIMLVGGISASEIAFLASIILIPWALKVFFAILSDKFGSKRLGRRKPYILGPIMIAGIVWFFLSIPNIATPNNALLVFTLAGVLINFGVAISDTALDGFIIDICPKERLGRTQGFCWGMNSVGQITGGPFLAFLLVIVKLLTVQSIFIIVGISMIITSLLMLIVKDKEYLPKFEIKVNLKNMFNNKRDWLAFFYSMLRALLDGVIVLLISIFVLIKIGVIKSNGATLTTRSGDMSIYIYQANVSFIISIGIIVGAILGGQLADLKSRRFSVMLSVLITTLSLLLFMSNISYIPLILLFASLTGAALGWRRASASAIMSQLSKKHPEMDSTYFSVAMAFANIGASIGLALSGIILDATQNYSLTFLYLALISLLVIIPLLLMNPKDYEHKFME
ncbi:MAG: MFS transporter [Promethearchaeota archaeon]|nr:MAG: MFS transporter [Candidatus Lokiarchaeota archaeon]